jgi:hypothetical protein
MGISNLEKEGIEAHGYGEKLGKTGGDIALTQTPLTAAVGLYSTAAPFLISSIPSSSRTYLIAGRIYPIGHSY